MTRFHGLLILSASLGAAAWWRGGWPWVIPVALGFLLVVGIGVASPRLRLFGPFVCHGSRTARHVALTFDDGPDPRSTPALLDLLREAGVRVAFFGVGECVAAHPELAARIVREGHLLENHSFAHSHFTNFFSTTRLQAELARAQTAIQQATGVAPRWFRPPMGLSNPRVFRAARALGLTVVGWSSRGFDTRATDPARVVARITRSLVPGAIILLHDGNIPAQRLIATVKSLLAAASARDLKIVRLDQLLRAGSANERRLPDPSQVVQA